MSVAVMIADDNDWVRLGLRQVLTHGGRTVVLPDVRLIGECRRLGARARPYGSAG